MSICAVLAQYDQTPPTPTSAVIGLAPIVLLLVGLYVFFRRPPRPGQPPHKTKHFWLLLPLFVIANLAYHYTTRSHSQHDSTFDAITAVVGVLGASVFTWLLIWFAQRVRSGLTKR